jgi:hypothetical protein
MQMFDTIVTLFILSSNPAIEREGRCEKAQSRKPARNSGPTVDVQKKARKRESEMPEQKPPEQRPEDSSRSVDRLKEESQEIKARIEQEKRKHDLPLDSNLGNPAWEESVADGRLDLPEEDDD